MTYLTEAAAAEIDLEPIVIKAMCADEGMGWSFDFACQVAREYRRFLVLCSQSPEAAVVPSALVDDFWHLHILDTAKYMADCERYLGYYLHHFPYFGMRGAQDARNLADAWEGTLALYGEAFGEEADPQLWPRSKRCPNCGRRREGADEKRPSFADHGLAAA